MNQTKFNLSDKQIEWLNELLFCDRLSLIIEIPEPDKEIIVGSLHVRWYYDYDRVLLNEYLKEYPLPLLQKLLRERK
jgi:hypothetical protein